MKTLIVSPHTDDAEIGCGGTIYKLLEEENSIYWIVFSTAEASLPKNLPKDTLKREFLSVLHNYNIPKLEYEIFNYEVRNLNNYRQEILQTLVDVGNKFSPDLVIGPSLNDFHQDHQIVANEVVRAFKMSASIIAYELPWNHITFNTQLFVKLQKKHLDKKWAILQNYKTQFLVGKQYFSKEFIFGLAKTRGVQCNAMFAEAFEVIRWMM